MALSCQVGQQQFETSSYGLKGGLGLENIKEVVFAMPSLQEQREIVGFVKAKLCGIDKTVEKILEQTARLREYRQAIISTAVTGQLDLSKEAA